MQLSANAFELSANQQGFSQMLGLLIGTRVQAASLPNSQVYPSFHQEINRPETSDLFSSSEAILLMITAGRWSLQKNIPTF